MFNGVPSDEFHRFIFSRNSSLPLPLHPFSDNFNPFSSSTSLHQFQRQESVVKNAGKQLQRNESMDPWSADELLALLKVRSSMENWFPDISWELVSRKLAGLGFLRNAEQCKEKFEDESINFNSLSYEKNCRIFNEFDAFYTSDSENQEKSHVSETVKQIIEGDKVQQNIHVEELETEKFQESEEMEKKTEEKTRKRKRKDKFEVFKGFCEAIVSKMIAQQEELHNKLIEDLVRRDKEMAEREEAWKKQEMDRIKRENEINAQEQAIAGERQAKIIEFLRKIQDLVKLNDTDNAKIFQDLEYPSEPNKPEAASSSPRRVESHENPSSDIPFESKTEAIKVTTPSPPSPSSSLATKNSEANSCSISALTNENIPISYNKSFQMMDSRGDIGKRWPRDEVLALINLRCKFSGNVEETKEGLKGPLWERISQGMIDLGYKRNAKRCKEKWENINKYFRKTKDSTKKRSMDSRTCPYFHQLTSLYSGGTLGDQSNVPENSE